MYYVIIYENGSRIKGYYDYYADAKSDADYNSEGMEYRIEEYECEEDYMEEYGW